MPKIVFLLEEPSMKNTLEHILPKILSKDVAFQLVEHEGKSSLQKSIPIKLKGWKGVHFVIVQDQDSGDCVSLKNELRELACKSGRDDTLVRIVCRELEAWFLGDFEAVEEAYGIDLSKVKNKKKYRNPDMVENAKEELKKIVHSYQPYSGSGKIAQHMDIERNKAHSFKVFVEGVRRLNDRILSH
ncbi:MAG: DUF4276 family protein [Clostridiales Family XIII bacterium]|jgi:uncharacterized protein YktA (UPF0223 family)|nr:DUF4276 family protein [Clostridiales Family XIII bacterium]